MARPAGAPGWQPRHYQAGGYTIYVRDDLQPAPGGGFAGQLAWLQAGKAAQTSDGKAIAASPAILKGHQLLMDSMVGASGGSHLPFAPPWHDTASMRRLQAGGRLGQLMHGTSGVADREELFDQVQAMLLSRKATSPAAPRTEEQARFRAGLFAATPLWDVAASPAQASAPAGSPQQHGGGGRSGGQHSSSQCGGGQGSGGGSRSGGGDGSISDAAVRWEPLGGCVVDISKPAQLQGELLLGGAMASQLVNITVDGSWVTVCLATEDGMKEVSMQFNNRLLPAADVACALGVHADANTATDEPSAPGAWLSDLIDGDLSGLVAKPLAGTELAEGALET